MTTTIDIRGETGSMAVGPATGGGVEITGPSLDTLLISDAQADQLATAFGGPLPPPALPNTMLANGDSITYGVRPGVLLADTFIQKMGTFRSFTTIVNTAVPGDSSAQMLAHWAADIATHNPGATFLGASANNLAKGVSLTQAKSHYTDMISMSLDHGAPVTLASHPIYRDGTYLHNYQLGLLDVLRELSAINGVTYIDVFSEWCREIFYMGYTPGQTCPAWDALYAPDANGNPDYIHPSAAGHEKLFQFFKKFPGAFLKG